MLGRLLTLYILWKTWRGVLALREKERLGMLWRRSYNAAPVWLLEDALDQMGVADPQAWIRLR